MTRLAISLFLVYILYSPLFSAPAAEPSSRFETDDGLYVRFRPSSGEILALMDRNESLDLSTYMPDPDDKVAYQPFSVVDSRDPSRTGDFDLALVPDTGSSLTLEASDEAKALRLRAAIDAEYATLRFHISLENLSKRSRKLTLRYSIPLTPKGWSLWRSLNDAQPVNPGDRAALDPSDRSDPADFPIPLGVISDSTGRHVLALAAPLSCPAVVRTSLDKFFFIDLEIQLDPADAPAAKRDLAFHLYSSAPKRGLRGALRKYYDTFPADFEKRARVEGPLCDEKWPPGEAAKTGMAYCERRVPGPEAAAFNNQAGILNFVEAFGAKGDRSRVLEDGATAEEALQRASDLSRERLDGVFLHLMTEGMSPGPHYLLQSISSRIRPRGKLLLARIPSPPIGAAPFADILGTDGGAITAQGGFGSLEESALACRLMMFQKPVVMHLVATSESAALKPMLDRLLLHGVHASVPYRMFEGAPKALETFAKISRLTRDAAMAGWEPVPFAAADSKSIRFERFGYAANNTLRYVLLNDSSATQTFRFNIEAAELKLSHDAVAWNDATNALLSSQQTDGLMTIPISFPPNAGIVVRVGKRGD